MIDRPDHLSAIRAAQKRSRIVALTGPRQCGKTTLARQLVPEDSVNYFDLEDPVSIARLDEPMTALRELKGLVVIDEVQRRPDLFPVLRVLADRKSPPDQVSYPWQRVAGADATVLGDTGRTAGDVGDGRLQPAGVGYGRRTPALAAWGISVVLSGTDRFGQRGLAEEFHPDFLGT